MTAAVDVRDVSLRYGSTLALDRLDLSIEQGCITAVLGPNGAGKSTTMAVITGLRSPDSGFISVLGGAPGRFEARCRVGVMLQEGGIPTGATGASIVHHHARLRGSPTSAAPLIEALGIGPMGRTTYRRMSGGQRKAVALACALVGSPEVVIVDEPTAGLDPSARRETWELLDERRRQGTTVILCTHDLAEAERLGDSIAIIDRGRRVVQGSPQELLAGADETVILEGPLRLDLDGLIDALPDDFRVEEVVAGRYRVSGELRPEHFATISAWAGQHGIPADRIRHGRWTLEDLYFSTIEESTR